MEEIKQLDRDESEQILKLPNSWRERGILEGMKEGIKKGMKEGMEKGMQEGQQKGEHDAQRKIALNLLKEGFSIEFIAKVTNLDYAEIEELGKQI
ncbi:hypothetical protein RCG24_12365 [Neobacillus sp. OS1-32]|uniref:hypothetical protein n=1 Tax=Neobacillus sp. OS1-32 TaxID=3070682 RepID=UPI0027E16418|nr:hypothetical protein [Neobacillus sp. OS1-32]WML28823.1 hypothetical protein RCG24_12365 [Neobacillus sp. OS1-32]